MYKSFDVRKKFLLNEELTELKRQLWQSQSAIDMLKENHLFMQSILDAKLKKMEKLVKKMEKEKTASNVITIGEIA